MEDHSISVAEHYTPEDLLERIYSALRTMGKDPKGGLTVEDLAPVDQFHTHALKATKELADYGEIPREVSVIDVGSGLGGPARYLATTLGCRVTGVDLSETFCTVATALSECCGLSETTTFHKGNALALPEEDDRFDLAWTVQAQMNIEDKRRFYGEILRVLKPGGRLVFQDIMAGNGAGLVFPVPWAGDGTINFLIPEDSLRGLLAGLGFREIRFINLREGLLANPPPPPVANAELPPLGIHLVMGETFLTKRKNINANFREGRIEYVRGVYEKPA